MNEVLSDRDWQRYRQVWGGYQDLSGGRMNGNSRQDVLMTDGENPWNNRPGMNETGITEKQRYSVGSLKLKGLSITRRRSARSCFSSGTDERPHHAGIGNRPAFAHHVAYMKQYTDSLMFSMYQRTMKPGSTENYFSQNVWLSGAYRAHTYSIQGNSRNMKKQRHRNSDGIDFADRWLYQIGMTWRVIICFGAPLQTFGISGKSAAQGSPQSMAPHTPMSEPTLLFSGRALFALRCKSLVGSLL